MIIASIVILAVHVLVSIVNFVARSVCLHDEAKYFESSTYDKDNHAKKAARHSYYRRRAFFWPVDLFLFVLNDNQADNERRLKVLKHATEKGYTK